MYRGHLLVAVGKYVNKNIFPITYVVIDSKYREKWWWSLQLVLDDIGSVKEHNWTFIFDRQKVCINKLD